MNPLSTRADCVRCGSLITRMSDGIWVHASGKTGCPTDAAAVGRPAALAHQESHQDYERRAAPYWGHQHPEFEQAERR